MYREVEMGGGKQGSLKPIEYGNATVGVVELRRRLENKKGI